MAQPVKVQPFTRLTHPDPKTNQVISDLYDKIQQLQAQLAQLQSQIPPTP